MTFGTMSPEDQDQHALFFDWFQTEFSTRYVYGGEPGYAPDGSPFGFQLNPHTGVHLILRIRRYGDRFGKKDLLSNEMTWKHADLSGGWYDYKLKNRLAHWNSKRAKYATLTDVDPTNIREIARLATMLAYPMP